jgi:acetylornithine deacetylase
MARAADVSTELILDAAQALIRTPSVNPSLVPSGTGEREIAHVAKAWLTSRGIQAWLEEAAPARPNLVAQLGAAEGPTLVFCAHLDTVGVEGMSIPPFEPRIDSGKLYGRGSYDMKGSAAAIMAAAVTLARQNLQVRVLLALVADEEHASAGAVDFVRRHRADACILTEPSHGQLVLAHKGFVWAEIVTRGRAAHGSRWELGVSAVGRMGRVIAALEEFDRRDLRRHTHGLVGPASLHCAMVSGGTGWSTYAPECRLKVERRTVPGETPAGVMEELRQVVRSAGEDADVALIFERPPLVCDPETHVARIVRQAAASVHGAPAEEIGVAYWMDAAIFAAAGIPTVNYGPAGDGAHGEVEWVDIDSLVTTARVLVESARRFGVSGAGYN